MTSIISHCLETKQTTRGDTGVFATATILPGSCVLSDQPILILNNNFHVNDLEKAFHRLPVAERIAFDALHEANIRYPTRRNRIYRSNAFSYPGPTSTGCICLKMSRFNHSCIPTASYTWNPFTKQYDVFALLPINVGQEVTVNYSGMFAFMDAKSRNKYLEHHYQFTCTCIACKPGTAFQYVSDMRRNMMLVIQHTLNGTEYSSDYKMNNAAELEAMGICLQMSKKRLTLVEEAHWAWILAKLMEAESQIGTPLIAPYAHASFCMEQAVMDYVKKKGKPAPELGATIDELYKWRHLAMRNMVLCHSPNHQASLAVDSGSSEQLLRSLWS